VNNGVNSFPYQLNASNNPNLTCIEVNNLFLATNNWTVANGLIDPQMSFSQNCGNACSVGLEEHSNNTKQLNKIVDLMGRETRYKSNTVLIYVYTDGSIERVCTFE
jgi:hypothetical protein